MSKIKKRLLSVIVPAYKQEKVIVEDLKRIESVLRQIRYDYEIICVVDGRRDKTFENAKKVKSKKIRVISYQENRGKGYAVRYGMARTRGDLIAFIDAGMDIDPNGISMILEHMEWYDADVIVGSKRHPASEVYYPLPRRLLSLATQITVWTFFGLRVRDTQVGLKVFRRKVLERVLPRLLLKRFAFDIELLAVARHLGFTRIYEAPIKLSYKFVSTVRIFGRNGIWEAFADTLAVFYRLRVLHYYDDRNKRRWKYDKDLDFRVNIG